ncbi:MAG: DUF4395 domain-containing protein [Corynebacterium sp.]|uniref:DUF4395 domain-containing protein n=1 Tax=Corynebacterium TaxID=1716 RepID=UPI002647C1DA|nr:DUF4395 domain-containing protein [Corynebacterium sp.]MDN5582594.1 DUF4395 domain-containing protein [Corynebacterium sp.]MDN5721143.1 DUF4395 domain-containing protein [Corynebacterium sp.]MDN6324272.1 DUF4395 domain-containing protein [Corynebacterium sp.]MDN6387993.1 DUF4395 domain-containing protein [Corynebacterium sp.]MDN6509681.1 DUF4395 domain-containing protein [Corynebacterium sp.]
MDEQLTELNRLGRQRPGFIAGQDAVASAPNAPNAQPPGGIRSLWWFPPVVNDRAARTTAMLVVVLALVTVALSRAGLDVAALVAGSLLLAGFVLRVLAGPRFDPFGQLSVRWLAPRVFGEPVMVGGAPKRFAQTIGLVFSAAALGLRVAGLTGASDVVLLLLVVAASLEGFLGICLGCLLFARLQGWGVVRDDVRADCAVPMRR